MDYSQDLISLLVKMDLDQIIMSVLNIVKILGKNEFICSKCPLNYNKNHLRSQVSGQCLNCPLLCVYCQQRSTQDIQLINPYFQIYSNNSKFTTKCLQKQSEPNIIIDPKLYIARYCYSSNCLESFQYFANFQCEQINGLFIYELPYNQNFIEFKFNFDYFNEVGLQNYILTLPFKNLCKDNNYKYPIFNFFKEKIFSFQHAQLILLGDNNPTFLGKTFIISNFDSVKIDKVQFYVNAFLDLTFQNREKSIDFIILNSGILSNNKQPIYINFGINNFYSFHLENFQIANAIIENTVLFNININTLGDDIILKDVQLFNSTFQNSSFIIFLNLKRNIFIDKLTIDQCQFYDSTLANFILNSNSSNYVKINQISIKNSFFNSSNLIKSVEKVEFIITTIKIEKNEFRNTMLIVFNYDFFIIDIDILDNYFYQSIFLVQISSFYLNNEIHLQNLKAQENQFFKFQLFLTQQKLQTTQINFKIISFHLEDNIHQNNNADVQFLFDINCLSILIKNIFIKTTQNLRYFYLVGINIQILKILLMRINFKVIKYKSRIQGMSSLTLNSVVIKNLFSLNQPLISIISTTINSRSPLEKLQIKNVLIQGNILIKSELGFIFSIIDINSENSQVIVFENISLIDNVFHQYITDPSKSSASLLYINSMQSSIEITNLICFQNSITNSTSPFISISSNKLQMKDIQVKNHNSIKREFWNLYYEIQIKEDQQQNQVDYMIKSIYFIKNRGGSKMGLLAILQLKHVQFLISTLKEKELQEFHIVISLIQENDGAISISSQNSYLKLKIQQLILTEVLNRQAPSIFSIYPSNVKNNIEMRDVFVTNFFSLNNQFIKLDFNAQNAKLNLVLIDNLRISQSVDNLLSYIQQIGILNQVQLQKMLINNAILNFLGCQLKINEFQIDGIVLSSVLKIMDSISIKLMNFKIVEIQTIYPIRLITIEQNSLLNQNINFQNILITKLILFSIKETTLKYIMYFPLDINFQKCSLESYDLIIQPQNQSLFLTYFFKQLSEFFSINQYQQGSLIYFYSKNVQTKIQLDKININNNDCQICLNGAIFFDFIDFNYVKVKDLNCVRNQIKQFGCISAHSNFSLESKIFVECSNFIENNGTQGTAISTRKIKIVLINSKIVGNYAIGQGGGLYIELNTREFLISSTLISNNQGKEGGVLINKISINLFLFQIMHNQQLKTYKNFQLIQLSQLIMLKCNILNQLSIMFYPIIQYQDLIKQFCKINSCTQIIYFCQVLEKFKVIRFIILSIKIIFLLLLNLHYLLRIDTMNNCFILKILLLVKSFKELLIKLPNMSQNSNKYKQSIRIQQKIILIQVLKLFYLILINKMKRIQKFQFNVKLNIKLKSFYCQLGEFYVSGGCQICQPIQGFYAVTYNTTKCSIFDKNKFDAITSNNIKLKQGYWRPNQISDDVELCFKNMEYCEGGWQVGDNICKIGHQGGLCEECDIYNIRGDGQFFKKQQDLVCQQCNDLQNSISPFVLILIWAIFSTYLTIKSVEKTNQLYTSLKLQTKYAQIIFKLGQDHESILLKLYLNYLWIFSTIFTFNISFSFSLGFLKQSNDTSYFMANNLDCFLSKLQDTQILYTRVIAMLLLLLCQIIIIYLLYKLLSIFYKNLYNDRIISITMLYLYVQNYASLINQFFSILSKRSISQIDYIQGDVSLLYSTENHTQWIFGLAIPGMLFIGLILPFSLILFLYFKRNYLDSIKLRRHIGYLFNEYNKSNYFWEWIKLWKKTIIIVIMINFETDVFLKASLIGLCLVSYQFISQRQQPYILKKFNILDIQTCQFCSIAIFLAAVKYRSEQQNSQFMSIFIQTLISILCIWLSYPFIFNILKEYYRKYKQPILSSLMNILNFSKITSKFTKRIQKKLAQWQQQEENKKKNIQLLRKISISRMQSERSGQKIAFIQISSYSKLYSDSKRTL
ncbi:unnamed protein product [Paramecium sonneborni]|uniref:Transmembrane protein n=1 Tax=Paramecium sonneborni TaxID=65129 RepID=A0A8S1QWD6_9CILI|nr:unnamed protein product [Paramecium sonneborni]